MSLVVTVEVPAEDFVLGEALATNPGIRVRLDHVVPLGSTFVPYLWASDDAAEEIERALRSVTGVDSFQVLDTVGEESLIRVEWTDDIDGVLEALEEAGATVLDAVGEDEVWTMLLRFPDPTSLTVFYRQCSERGMRVNVSDVFERGSPGEVDPGNALTDTQREALYTALVEGYFEIPRRTNLEGLAAELGISDNAASQRLRRGIASVLETLLDEEERKAGGG